MNPKSKLLIIPVIILLALLSIILLFKFNSLKKSLPPPPEIKVPEGEETDLPPEVASPQNVVKIENTSYRAFSLSLKDESLDKPYIYAYQNDIITINFLSLDKEYEIEITGYNLNVKINKDSEKTIQFQALNKGNFEIICKNCGNKKLGEVIIK